MTAGLGALQNLLPNATDNSVEHLARTKHFILLQRLLSEALMMMLLLPRIFTCPSANDVASTATSPYKQLAQIPRLPQCRIPCSSMLMFSAKR